MKLQTSKSIFAHLCLVLLGVTLLSAAQAQQVQVNSANPDMAEQGSQDVDIEISGNGFDNSAAVDFFLTGTNNPGGVVVKNVKVRGPKKIIATVDVESEAIIDLFDIEVSLSNGRRGRGTTLFSVIKKASTGNNTVPQLRLQFRNAATDGLSSDPTVNGGGMSMLCAAADSPDAQYWVADPVGGFVDVNCQGIKDLAPMSPGLTGPEGLWFLTHMESVRLPADLPTSNRWLTLNFGDGIDADLDGDGDLDPSACHNIDALEYIHPETADPEIADLVPPIDPDACIDNLQGLFRTGVDIFNLSDFFLVDTGARLQIRIPVAQQLNRKKRAYGIDPAYELQWETVVVTDAGNGDRVTIGCGNELGVAGHTCRATLTRGGVTGGSRYPDAEIIGVYEIPFSLTIQRVFCNADGSGCAVP